MSCSAHETFATLIYSWYYKKNGATLQYSVLDYYCNELMKCKVRLNLLLNPNLLKDCSHENTSLSIIYSLDDGRITIELPCRLSLLIFKYNFFHILWNPVLSLIYFFFITNSLISVAFCSFSKIEVVAATTGVRVDCWLEDEGCYSNYFQLLQTSERFLFLK